MKSAIRGFASVMLWCLPCVVFPLGIGVLASSFGYDRLLSDDAFTLWPLYAIDLLFWADLLFTTTLLWLMQGWRLLVALVAIPMLCLTAVLAITGGAWVEGTYF
jgi:hypothetical protein